MTQEILEKQIGKICLNFSVLELLISAFASRLISKDSKIGAIVTSEMSFKNLLNAFDSLIIYRYSNEVKILDNTKNIVKRLNIVEQNRNKMIHSSYAIKEGASGIFILKVTSKQSKGLAVSEEVINEEKFKNILEESFKLINELEILYKELYNEKIKFA